MALLHVIVENIFASATINLHWWNSPIQEAIQSQIYCCFLRVEFKISLNWYNYRNITIIVKLVPVTIFWEKVRKVVIESLKNHRHFKTPVNQIMVSCAQCTRCLCPWPFWSLWSWKIHKKGLKRVFLYQMEHTKGPKSAWTKNTFFCQKEWWI